MAIFVHQPVEKKPKPSSNLNLSKTKNQVGTNIFYTEKENIHIDCSKLVLS